jgi:hypothetical protein
MSPTPPEIGRRKPRAPRSRQRSVANLPFSRQVNFVTRMSDGKPPLVTEARSIEFWRRAEALFSAALDAPAAARLALLERACAHDRKLLAAVQP